jgi:hypothetical protein
MGIANLASWQHGIGVARLCIHKVTLHLCQIDEQVADGVMLGSPTSTYLVGT